MSDILFQISNASSFVSHVLTGSAPVHMLREIENKYRGVVCNVWTCYCSYRLNMNMYLLISIAQKLFQYSSKWIKNSKMQT